MCARTLVLRYIFYIKKIDLPVQGEVPNCDNCPNRLQLKGSLIQAAFQGLYNRPGK